MKEPALLVHSNYDVRLEITLILKQVLSELRLARELLLVKSLRACTLRNR